MIRDPHVHVREIAWREVDAELRLVNVLRHDDDQACHFKLTLLSRRELSRLLLLGLEVLPLPSHSSVAIRNVERCDDGRNRSSCTNHSPTRMPAVSADESYVSIPRRAPYLRAGVGGA
jgi:hypothetical protein